MNRWGIPLEIEKIVNARDKSCVYCRCKFSSTERKSKASWEHIINDVKITELENIALCCVGCNASKGSKTLMAWLDSKYCKEKSITFDTVAEIIRAHILKYVYSKK